MTQVKQKNIFLFSDIIAAVIIALLVIEHQLSWHFVLALTIPVMLSFVLFERRDYIYFLLIYLSADLITAYLNNGLNLRTFTYIIFRLIILIIAAEAIFWYRKKNRQVKENLITSELKFLNLLNYTYDWEYYITRSGKLEYSSPSCEIITQYSPDEFIENPNLLLSIVHPDDQEKVKEHYLAEKMGKNPDPIEFKVLKKNGDFRIIRHTCNPVFNDENKFLGTRVTNRNSTDRWKAETVLKENEAKYRYIFENLVDVYYRVSLDGTIEMLSPSVKNISGYSADELIGTNAVFLYNDSHVRDQFIEMIKSKGKLTNYEMEFKDKNGEVRMLSFNSKLVYDDNNKPISIEGIFRDVTSEYEVKKELERERNKFKSLFETNLAAVFITDIEGGIIECNPSAAKIFGFENTGELKKYNVRKMYLYPEDRIHYINRLKKEKALFGYEYPLKRTDGTIFWVLENSRLLENNRIIGTMIDITELKNVEKQLRDSEKSLIESNAAKDRFFSIIAHDVRSPFTSLLGLAQMVREDWEEMSEEDKLSAIIHLDNVSKKIFKLLEGLLEWSRIQTNRIEFEPDEFILKDLIESVIHLYFDKVKEKNIQLDVIIESQIKVFTDENLLCTVIRNLLTNALKFTPVNGKIFVSASQSDGFTEISVADSGIGIDKDTLSKLFRIDEKITTLGTEGETGTGMGLVLCSELVKKMGGKIWVESELSKGSKFYFTIPTQIDK